MPPPPAVSMRVCSTSRRSRTDAVPSRRADGIRMWRISNAVSASDAVADEAGGLRPGLLENLRDRLLRLLGERLLEEDVLLEVAVDPALDDPREGGLRLALLLGRGLGDATLVVDRRTVDLLAGEDRRAERRDVHRDVAGHLLLAACRGDEDADLRRQVGARPGQGGHDPLAPPAGPAAVLDILPRCGLGPLA